MYIYTNQKIQVDDNFISKKFSVFKNSDMSSTRICPEVVATQQACINYPNSVWDGTKCVCCNTGTHYANTSDGNCLPCGPNARCGDGNGYCSETNNPACIQNPNTQKYELACTPGTCTGKCTGSCGIGEWLTFSICSRDTMTNTNSCRPSISQWKSWIVYIGIFLLFLFLIIIIVAATRRSSPRVIVPPYASLYTAPPITIT